MPPKTSTADQVQALKQVREAARKYHSASLPPLKRVARQALREAVTHAASAGVRQIEVVRASGLSKAQVSRLARGATSGRSPLPPAVYLSATLPAAEICVRYQDGESTNQLAKVYGCSNTTIIGILKRHDVPRRVGRTIELPVPDEELARRYLQDRMELQQLAEELGVKPNLVSRRVAAAGVKVPVGHRRMDLPDAEIVRRYKAGESANRIAKSYGVSHVTVMRRVREDRSSRGV
ncbi:hypothetical protein ACN6K5_003612 [Streptomyces violaceoruber]